MLVGMLVMAVVGTVVAAIVIGARADKPKDPTFTKAVLGIGAAIPVAMFATSLLGFVFHVLPLGDILQLLVSIALSWVAVSVLLDRFCNLDYESSYAVTAKIVVPTYIIVFVLGCFITACQILISA